jgi:two-component system LytT family sensor kinase
MKEWLQHKKIWSVPLYHAWLLVLFFMGMGTLHGLVIFLSGFNGPGQFMALAIDYMIMFLLTIPVWWLHFRKFRDLPVVHRILLHMATCIFFVKVWRMALTGILPELGLPHSPENAVWWDLYMCTMVYGIVFSIIHVYRFFIEKIEQQQWERELQSLAYKSEINALKAQIQPHFLFNTLNSISASVDAKHERTRTLITKLADTFRYSLHASQNEWVNLNDEIDFIKTLLELENERFGQRLTFEVLAECSQQDIRIPPMLLQPIIENAVRHGIAPCLEGGKITLGCEQYKEGIRIYVANTGMHFEGDVRSVFASKGIGLRNTNLRLQKLYNQSIHVERNEPSGLIFSFLVPVHK